MSDSDPNKTKPEIIPRDIEVDFSEGAETEASTAETNTPSVKGEAAQFDRSQVVVPNPSKARIERK